MKTAIATLRGVSPYSQSRAHEAKKLARETHEDYEARTWREKCHAMPDGRIFIPSDSFKQAIDKAAKMLGRQIKGKGKATYTKFFLAGVLCTDPIILPNAKDEVQGVRIYANADGVRGSGKRVWRIYPVIDEWVGVQAFHVLADELTEEVFEEHLVQAGQFVGIGRRRPENGGPFGRFAVEKVEWK